jgi:hypothetical protein
MSRYRRAKIKGGTFFFTVTLVDRQATFWLTRSIVYETRTVRSSIVVLSKPSQYAFCRTTYTRSGRFQMTMMTIQLAGI